MIFSRMTRLVATLALVVVMAGETMAQQIVTDGGRSYKLHTVAKGESFYRLCLDYGVSQEDIISANPSLKNTGLVEGVVLRIPMKLQNLPQSPVTYTVKKGDTAYSIARTHGLTVEKLQALNPQIAQGIHEGDVLKLTSSTGGTEPKAMVEYTVVKGDTMFGIAQRNGLTIPQLLALNPSIASGIKVG
ncbi:MAG: LysM peptidoglycan-binding domain-containing protein, partial [Bacteroidales bacterium]|nr:LysM peptidoglycan-binding domain-containing protein [Bacteroidales bacterium]